MAFNIKNREADRLVRDLMESTGERLTEAVTKALRERLAREHARRSRGPLEDELNQIALGVAALPRLDTRAAGDIIGYNDFGLPE